MIRYNFRNSKLIGKLSQKTAMEEKITTRNASKLTTYQLRQELNRRGAFDLEESTVNYKTMLGRLMQELVKDEQKEQEQAVTAKSEEHKQVVDREKEIREQRKQEALERSRQRQANKTYFESKQQANVEAAERKAVAATEADNIEVERPDLDTPETAGPIDPFRLVPTGRSKVFVK